jgi:hypothetical protein
MMHQACSVKRDNIFNKHENCLERKKLGWTLTYCHVHGWLQMGFGQVIGFIDHLQNVTTLYKSLSHTVTSSLAVAWKRLPMADIPLILGSRTISMPQLSTSNSKGSQQLKSSSPPTDCSPHSTLLNCTKLTNSHQLRCL